MLDNVSASQTRPYLFTYSSSSHLHMFDVAVRVGVRPASLKVRAIRGQQMDQLFYGTLSFKPDQTLRKLHMFLVIVSRKMTADITLV